jgi:hypothetical protein
MKSPALLLGCVFVMSAVHAETPAIYDANRDHPWNRLSAALHTDAPLDFEAPGTYEARVLTGEHYEMALKALDDFLKHHSEKSIKSPIKRAILQSELWATFDQVSDAAGGMQDARREISRRCAAIIKRLALSDAEIAGLPDNYAITVASKEFPHAYDPAHPEKIFLPDDLLVDEPPWIMLSASATEILQPAAIQHVKATQGRAVFYAVLRLPAGRQATLAYLKKLAEFPQPYAWNETYKLYPYARSAVKVNPDLPQFPPGTQAALIRRMVLTNSNGELVVTPITESVQIRVYAKDPHEVRFESPDAQYFHEMTLAAEGLFLGNGGLRVTKGEPPSRRLTFARATLFSQRSHCSSCHGGAGVLALNTYTHAFGTLPNTPWFEPTSATRQDTNTLNWKKRDYTWGLLSALLESR